VKYAANGKINKLSLPSKRKLDNELSKYEWLIKGLKNKLPQFNII
jgi:hypothetical protein